LRLRPHLRLPGGGRRTRRRAGRSARRDPRHPHRPARRRPRPRRHTHLSRVGSGSPEGSFVRAALVLVRCERHSYESGPSRAGRLALLSRYPGEAMNLVNLESVSHAYGPKPLLTEVSLGIDEGERIGVVGRNGGGKTTLLRVIAGDVSPDSGRVTRTRGLRVGFLSQQDLLDPGSTVRDLVLGDMAEHEWAGDQGVREILGNLIGDIDLDAKAGDLSGGERRRTALARLPIGEHDLIMLDEPTNHLDIEAIAWLAAHLSARKSALVVVTHDRWFLDAVSTRTWEVVDGRVERYEGGYAAY